MPYENEKEVAVEAALTAGRLCEQIRQEMVPEAIEKRDGTPVTVADFVSQAIICRALAQAFPTDPVVAEEDAAQLSEPGMAERLEKITEYVRGIVPSSKPESVINWVDQGGGMVGPRYWALDPIDGTKGFLRGDQYAIAVALIEEGDVKLGVLACPSLNFKRADREGKRGVLFAAVRGQGATNFPFSGGRPRSIHVAGVGQMEGLPFVESVESSHCDQALQADVAKAVGMRVPPWRVDGQAKYGIVARGDAGVYLRFPYSQSPRYLEKIWDHAAGALIVQEAGGLVTDMKGHPIDFFQGPELLETEGIVAGNASIHEKVLEALKMVRH
jgi:3'(2'), 5'-bisphosphate nucleotidase